MFKILLIQNLNEMRNYSYADCRNMLTGFGFEVELYTMENIDRIPEALTDGSADCIVFASNSLNDKVIRNFVYGAEFQAAFAQFVAEEKACLILHQNGVTTKYGIDDPFPFVDQTASCHLEAVFHKPEEVELSLHECFYPQYFAFPHSVRFEDIAQKASCAHLTGLYWTTAVLENNDFWLPVLRDSKGHNLMIKSIKHKILYSSLLLDWQSHGELLNNVLINLIVDNNSLAILECAENDSLGFNYFLHSLRSNKLYFLKYDIDRPDHPFGYDTLVKNISLGLHSTLLVTNSARGFRPRPMSSLSSRASRSSRCRTRRRPTGIPS